MKARWIFVIMAAGTMVGLSIGLGMEVFNTRLFASNVATGTTVGLGLGLFFYAILNPTR
jgi:hypothetical protein